MDIKPRIKGFICTTAHPEGCLRRVEEDVRLARADAPPSHPGPKRVLVIGASAGYGLACRVTAAFTYGAETLGLSLEREESGNRTASAGWYNNEAFAALAARGGPRAETLNGDAFDPSVRAETAEKARAFFTGGQIDLVIYSLAAPRRTDPATGESWRSVIKPLGAPFSGQHLDVWTGEVSRVTLEPAAEEETAATVKVMGGGGWLDWIETLTAAGLLADRCQTVSFSYIGPEKTHAIYKNGTIGRAKEDLEHRCADINALLASRGGRAFVSVNKALVTQASAAIPVVPLYISLLYRVMKDAGLHEGCQEQAQRLFSLLYGDALKTDEAGRLRLDDREMRPDIQAEVDRRWTLADTASMPELADLEGYRADFMRLFGFAPDGGVYGGG
ncbi:MAG: trans-2-enoyl-CoA reductase family protein [Oscillospiraceae bacterium]|nr:trans-2-enoyl-CoA reductase family protein [Oscillospiraceae bacterium]